MSPHIADARKAATLTLWAACAGAPMDEAIEMMRLATEIWPVPPRMVGKGSPLADSPSAEAWTNAAAALEAARDAQGAHLGIDWAQRAEAERPEYLAAVRRQAITRAHLRRLAQAVANAKATVRA
jgi:hypothetical protein